jgi:hypothetical protein
VLHAVNVAPSNPRPTIAEIVCFVIFATLLLGEASVTG